MNKTAEETKEKMQMYFKAALVGAGGRPFERMINAMVIDMFDMLEAYAKQEIRKALLAVEEAGTQTSTIQQSKAMFAHISKLLTNE